MDSQQRGFDNYLLERGGSWRREQVHFIHGLQEKWRKREQDNYDKYQEMGQPQHIRAYESARDMLSVFELALNELDERDLHYSAFNDTFHNISKEIADIEDLAGDPEEALEQVKKLVKSYWFHGSEYRRIKGAYSEAYKHRWEGFDIYEFESYDDMINRMAPLISSLRDALSGYDQIEFTDKKGNPIVVTAKDMDSVFFYAAKYLDKKDTHFTAMQNWITHLQKEVHEYAEHYADNPARAIERILSTIDHEVKFPIEYTTKCSIYQHKKDYARVIAGTKISNDAIDSICIKLDDMQSQKNISQKNKSALGKAVLLFRKIQMELNKPSDQKKRRIEGFV